MAVLLALKPRSAMQWDSVETTPDVPMDVGDVGQEDCITPCSELVHDMSVRPNAVYSLHGSLLDRRESNTVIYIASGDPAPNTNSLGAKHGPGSAYHPKLIESPWELPGSFQQPAAAPTAQESQPATVSVPHPEHGVKKEKKKHQKPRKRKGSSRVDSSNDVSDNKGKQSRPCVHNSS